MTATEQQRQESTARLIRQYRLNLKVTAGKIHSLAGRREGRYPNTASDLMWAVALIDQAMDAMEIREIPPLG
jgi:hypothetical protein